MASVEQRALNLAYAGAGPQDIAQFLGLTEQTVLGYLADLTADGASVEQRALSFVCGGHHADEVAGWLGVTTSTVLGWIADATTEPTAGWLPSGAVAGSSWRSLGTFNGATDGTAINALLTALSGPGIVFLPAGTGVIDQTIVLQSGQYLVGFGTYATILQAASGLNADVIQSQNFASLTGTDTTSTPVNLGFRGLTIDGNKSGNTSGRGASFYACNLRLHDFTIRNAAGCGLWTEWGSTSAATLESMENFISNFKIHDCVGEIGVSTHSITASPAGWCFLGPHDSQVNDGVMFYNGTDSSGTHHGQANLEIPAGSFGNGATFDNLHVFGGQTDYCIRNAGSGITFGPRMQCEGGRIAQMYLNGASTTRLYGKYFSGGVSTATVKGMKADSGASAISGKIKVENCGGGIADWTGSGGDHYLMIHATHTTQAPPSPGDVGTPGSNSRIERHYTDTSGVTTSDSILILPGRVTTEGGTLVAREYFTNGKANLRRSVPRQGFAAADTNPLSTGVMYLVAIELIRGDVVTNLTFKSHTTAANTPSHWWFALYDPSLNLLSQSADQGSAAWGAFTAKTLALGAAQTIASSDTYYAAIMVAATTPPTLDGVSGSANGTSANAYVTGEKVLAGTDQTHTGLTTTAPNTAATPTASGIVAMAVTS